MAKKADFAAIAKAMGKKNTSITGKGNDAGRKSVNTKGMQKASKTGAMKRGM